MLLYLILYMRSPYYRLYKTKLTLLAIMFIALGAALLLLTSWAEPLPNWSWLQRLPAGEFASGLLFTGLVAIFFQFWGWKDAQEHSRQEQERLIQNGAPAFVDAVVDALAFKPESLMKVVAPETLDRIVTNGLGLRLGDQSLAEEVYTDLRQQVVQARNRCYDAKVSVVLTPWEAGPKSGPDSMFVATVRWEYEVEPLSPTMRFSCVSSEREYRELLQDPTSTTTWFFKPAAGLERPRINQIPTSAPTPSVSLDFDGWVWPKSGTSFVWTLVRASRKGSTFGRSKAAHPDDAAREAEGRNDAISGR